MDEMEKKTDTSEMKQRENLYQMEEQFSDDTIGSLMAECEELSQQIYSEKDRLERFMLETGGASDASDRIQAEIDCMEDALAEAEKRLQVMVDAQEKEAFAPEKKAMREHKNTMERVSVKKKLAEKKAEAAIGKPHEKEKTRKIQNMNREI